MNSWPSKTERASLDKEKMNGGGGNSGGDEKSTPEGTKRNELPISPLGVLSRGLRKQREWEKIRMGLAD